jgi:hypothetical protein
MKKAGNISNINDLRSCVPPSPARREQQVHAIRHETMGVHRAFELGRQLPQVGKVKRTILIRIEAGAAVSVRAE